MTPYTSPIDSTHASSVAYLEQIRQRVMHFQIMEIDRWRPRPCPPDWKDDVPRRRIE